MGKQRTTGLTTKKVCAVLASGGVALGGLAGVNPEHPLINVMAAVALVAVTLIVVWFSGPTANLDMDRVSRWKFRNVEYESRIRIRAQSKGSKKGPPRK